MTLIIFTWMTCSGSFRFLSFRPNTMWVTQLFAVWFHVTVAIFVTKQRPVTFECFEILEKLKKTHVVGLLSIKKIMILPIILHKYPVFMTVTSKEVFIYFIIKSCLKEIFNYSIQENFILIHHSLNTVTLHKMTKMSVK